MCTKLWFTRIDAGQGRAVAGVRTARHQRHAAIRRAGGCGRRLATRRWLSTKCSRCARHRRECRLSHRASHRNCFRRRSRTDQAGVRFSHRLPGPARRSCCRGRRATPKISFDNARGVQLLVHEVAAANERALASSQEVRDVLAAHSSPEDAYLCIRVRLTAVLSQILAFDVSDDEILRRTRATYRGPVELGRDLMVIEIQHELQIRNAPSEPRRARH